MYRQLRLGRTSGWGGKRSNAGRKPLAEKALVSHAPRPAVSRRTPLHVTVRVLPTVWNLRSKRSFRVIAHALHLATMRDGFRIVDFSVQGNHIHLVVEVEDTQLLSRGMQALQIRVARRLNRMMGRSGRVFADRFHARVLRTATEIRHALHYVRNNRDHHRKAWETRPVAVIDRFSSVARENALLVQLPEGFLLRREMARLR